MVVGLIAPWLSDNEPYGAGRGIRPLFFLAVTIARMELPEIQKFMPLTFCFGLVGLGLAAFFTLLVVVATTARRRDDERD